MIFAVARFRPFSGEPFVMPSLSVMISGILAMSSAVTGTCPLSVSPLVFPSTRFPCHLKVWRTSSAPTVGVRDFGATPQTASISSAVFRSMGGSVTLAPSDLPDFSIFAAREASASPALPSAPLPSASFASPLASLTPQTSAIRSAVASRETWTTPPRDPCRHRSASYFGLSRVPPLTRLTGANCGGSPSLTSAATCASVSLATSASAD